MPPPQNSVFRAYVRISFCHGWPHNHEGYRARARVGGIWATAAVVVLLLMLMLWLVYYYYYFYIIYRIIIINNIIFILSPSLLLSSLLNKPWSRVSCLRAERSAFPPLVGIHRSSLTHALALSAIRKTTHTYVVYYIRFLRTRRDSNPGLPTLVQ